ncbi:MAG: type IV secretion system protein [Alphaproteobacteria bacterium]|nr:type IV secretion system protein [Alphaproteobacteria bacterium]
MDKSIQKANVHAVKQRKPSPSAMEAVNGGYAWLAKFFSYVCYLLVFGTLMLSLFALHLTKEVEVDAVLTTNPQFSENLAYFEPLHADMQATDVLSEMFVRQFIVTTQTVYSNVSMQRRLWYGFLPRLATPKIVDEFRTRMLPLFDGEHVPLLRREVDITKIRREGWNKWHVFFDSRTMEGNADPNPKIEKWASTITFRLYPSNVFLGRSFSNPLGFTVIDFKFGVVRQ